MEGPKDDGLEAQKYPKNFDKKEEFSEKGKCRRNETNKKRRKNGWRMSNH